MNKKPNISFKNAEKNLLVLAKKTHGFDGPIQWVFVEDILNYKKIIFVRDTFWGVNPPIAEKIFKAGMYQGFGVSLQCLGFCKGRLICTIELPETDRESELKMINGLKTAVLADPEKFFLVKNKKFWSSLKLLISIFWPFTQYAVAREFLEKEKIDEKIERLISESKKKIGDKNTPKFKKLKDVAHNLLQNICSGLCWVDENLCLHHLFLAAQKGMIKEIELNILEKKIEPRKISSPAISHVLQAVKKDFEYLLRTVSFPVEEIEETKIKLKFHDLKIETDKGWFETPEFFGEVKIKTKNGKEYSVKRSNTP